MLVPVEDDDLAVLLEAATAQAHAIAIAARKQTRPVAAEHRAKAKRIWAAIMGSETMLATAQGEAREIARAEARSKRAEARKQPKPNPP